VSRRSLVTALGLAVVLAIACTSVASAKYRGTDLWDNLMPSGGGGLVDRYPLSHYELDVHVDSPLSTGGLSVGNLFAVIGQFFAWAVVFIGVLFMRMVVVIFRWAFDADLVSSTLGPASTISQGYYSDFVQPFLAASIIVLGVWLAVKTLKSHERNDAGQSLVRVVVLFVVSMAIVFHPQQTVGVAFGAVNNLSSALIARGGDAQDVSDSIFSTFVYKPWAVLEFGGLKVCTGAQRDHDGFPLAATIGNPAKVCHSVLKQDADGHGDYARRFLSYAPGSDERDKLYESLRDGRVETLQPPPPVDTNPPDISHTGQPPALVTPAPKVVQPTAGMTIDRTDAPAVDLMQAGGTLQRVAYALLMLFSMVVGSLLLALISLASLFAQIAILLLVLLASFTLLAALLPPLHDRYMGWLKLLGQFLIGKATFSLMMAVVLATSSLLLKIGGQSGYFEAFVIQALLFGGVFYKRRWLLEKATSSRVVQHYAHHENHAVAGAAGAATMSAEAISGGASTFASTMRKGWSGSHNQQGDDTGTSPDSSSPPASAGREYSPPGAPSEQREAAPVSAARAAGPSAPADTITQEDDMPTRSFKDDLERARAAAPPPDEADEAAPPAREASRLVPSRSFADDLEVEHLSRERPLPPEQFERARLRDDLER
jgi:hypothetical protein